MKKADISIMLSLLAIFTFCVVAPQSVEAASDLPQENKLSASGSMQAEGAGEYVDDSFITVAVKGKILEEKGLSSMQIAVETKAGIVTLSGTTDTVKHAQLAANIAKQVGGVKGVVNNLKVNTEKSQSAGEYLDDATVTVAVKAKLMEEKNLSSMQIGVVTKDGVVTLSGMADTADHVQLAESVAKKVDGVKKVVNLLESKQ